MFTKYKHKYHFVNQISPNITKDLVIINKLLLDKIEHHGHLLSEISDEDENSQQEAYMKYAQLRSANMSRYCQLTHPMKRKHSSGNF